MPKDISHQYCLTILFYAISQTMIPGANGLTEPKLLPSNHGLLGSFLLTLPDPASGSSVKSTSARVGHTIYIASK
jgi:hypothetical protein